MPSGAIYWMPNFAPGTMQRALHAWFHLTVQELLNPHFTDEEAEDLETLKEPAMLYCL